VGSEQVVDLRRVVHVVSQQRLLVLACAAIGIMLGLLLAFQQAPTYVARSLVLLPPSGVDVRGNLLRNMLTEMQIASSGEIIEKVGSSLNPPLAPQEVRSRITVDATSSDLLQVTAEGGSGEQAALIADGVANAYVEYSNGTTSANSSAEIEGLVVRAGELDQRIQQLEEDIVSATAEVAALGEAGQESPEGLRRTALIDSLRIDQADSARQLSNINNRIAEARLDAELRRRGTRLLQPAIPPSAPSSPKPVVNAVVGALAGGLLGLLVVLARQLRGRRLVRRDDIADVVAAPVLASLNVPPSKGSGATGRSWTPGSRTSWRRGHSGRRWPGSGSREPSHRRTSSSSRSLVIGWRASRRSSWPSSPPNRRSPRPSS
jgi:capsular polysaccharide biosynthesis protein